MWEDFLDICVFSYNTSKHYSSKYVLAYCNKVKDAFLTDTILLCTDLLLLKSCLVKEPFIVLMWRWGHLVMKY